MKVLSRLKSVSDVKDWWEMTDDEHAFFWKTMPNFERNFNRELFDSIEKAERYVKDVEKQADQFFRKEEQILKEGKKLPSGEKFYNQRKDEFNYELKRAHILIDLFNSVDVGDSVEKTIDKLKSAFKNREISNVYDFSPEDFKAQYDKYFEKKSNAHTVKLDGLLDFYLVFRDGELINRYF